MVMEYGCQNMVDVMKAVLVKRPDKAFAEADPETWHYSDKPGLAEARREHDEFVKILRTLGVEVFYHDEKLPALSDAIYVHDPVIVTDAGAIILRMGKQLRRGEEDAMSRKLQALGIPILSTLQGGATAEGGDLLWVDRTTLAVGLGFRTNREGLRQIEGAVTPLGVNVIPVELPCFQGPDACLHLMSLISIVDHDLAVVYMRYLSVPFVRFLAEKGFSFVEVPDEEFMTMGPNVLAISPRNCLVLEGNPVTKQRLEKAGCHVYTYSGKEISLKAEGGPTCLTRPLHRAYQ